MNFTIREETLEDYKITENVIKQAFANVEISNKSEHELVARIRKSDTFIPALSLVAIEPTNKNIVGHILFSKINIIYGTGSVESLALAPVSVIPEYQRKGIGKLLIMEGLKIAKERGHTSIIVLGHPEYYPKFGFKKASLWGIKPPFHVSDEVFMAIELVENALDNTTGVVEYPSTFD